MIGMLIAQVGENRKNRETEMGESGSIGAGYGLVLDQRAKLFWLIYLLAWIDSMTFLLTRVM